MAAEESDHSFSDHQEKFLQNLFLQFANFGFDKAKEMIDGERDASRSSSSIVWQSLLMCVAQLASAEKLYMNLSFLTTKGFLRKESSLRATYEVLLNELSDIDRKRTFFGGHHTTNSSGVVLSAGQSSTPSTPGTPGADGVLVHLCTHIVIFIQARLQMIAFYERVVNMSNGKLMNFEELLLNVTDICARNSRHFHHPLFAPVKTQFTFECEILVHLLRSQIEMQCWRFLPSLLHLHDAHSKLNAWHLTVTPKEPKRYGFGSGFMKSSPLPALNLWLWQVKSAFVSKFSLYFYEILAAQTTLPEMKMLSSKQACDYVSKIQSFQRKSDAACICLVFEAAGVEDYCGPGYHHPDYPSPAAKGLDTYPAIFSYPPNKVMDRWPSIVMRITDRSSELSLMDRVVYFFDQQIGTSYFLCKIEPTVTVVVLFDTKKAEKDSYIKDFIYDLVFQLRCNKVFANLKPK